MNYLINEITSDSETEKRNAGSKAKQDIRTILSRRRDFHNIDINLTFKNRNGILYKITKNIHEFIKWKKIFNFKRFNAEDVLFFQYPMCNYRIAYLGLINYLKKSKTKNVVIIHDLDGVRKLNNVRFLRKEIKFLNSFDYVIEHNQKMKNKMLELGINKPRFVDLCLFDYITDKTIEDRTIDGDEIIIAGNLSKTKCGYIYDLPKNVRFGLYGVGYQGSQENINYYGSYLANEISLKIKGKFGLVWDGTSAKTCKGNYGNYLKINNPHKMSLYLSAGIPVIVWDESAVADFVIKNKCGITVSSLNEIHGKLETLTDVQYNIMLENARLLSEKVRNGYFTMRAVDEVLMHNYE